MGKKIPMWQCLVIILVMLAFLLWEIVVCQDGEGHLALICAAIFAAIVAVANGWKWNYLEQGIIAAINRSMQAMLILMMVGLLIGSWIPGGVIPSMIYYGLKVLSPSIFLFAGCLLCCIVSLATGTSWGTAGTIGVALIGVGMGLGVDPGMTAGAIVSGAYFGDKMSPLSDTTNLAPAIAGSTLFDHIRHMVWTTGPSLTIALIVYLIMGLKTAGDADMSYVNQLMNDIQSEFSVSPLYLIPPVFVIACVALKLPALPSLMGGVILGVICMAFQGIVDPKAYMLTLNYGFESANANPDLVELLSGGGMQNMMWTISLIMCAMVFGGIVDCTGVMGSFASVLMKIARGTRGGLVFMTIFSCIFVNAVCCDQYLAIILPGRMFKESFEDMRLKPKNLSRCLEDAGTITSQFFPWNTCGATMRTFLGVNQWGVGGYAPYAILNWLNPLVSIFYGFTGISMEKMTEEEYQKVLEEREAEKLAALKALEA
ncbi:MAG: Na+/H+ antiporter NhaC [Anaerovoracaceae bacterium]